MFASIGTFLLVVSAFVGTILFLVNPAAKFEKWARGKKASEVKAIMTNKLENDPGSALAQGCGFAIFVIIGVTYTFVIEPIAVITALISNIGYMPIAYAMLIIVGLSWINFARTLTSNKSKKAPNGTVMTAQGQKVEGVVIEVDEEVKFGNPVVNMLRRTFFFLPDLYLWYLFLVIIGVLE